MQKISPEHRQLDGRPLCTFFTVSFPVLIKFEKLGNPIQGSFPKKGRVRGEQCCQPDYKSYYRGQEIWKKASAAFCLGEICSILLPQPRGLLIPFTAENEQIGFVVYTTESLDLGKYLVFSERGNICFRCREDVTSRLLHIMGNLLGVCTY